MANIEEKVEALIKETVENIGYELYDVIYEKEAQDYYLRIFIDTPDGISLDDCEKVNDSITDMLDEANYIKDQYFLEVSSPGIERLLRKDKHLQAILNKEIEVNLFSQISFENEEMGNNTKNKRKTKQNSTKKIDGILKNFDDQKISLEISGQPEKIIEIERKKISNMKLKYNWE